MYTILLFIYVVTCVGLIVSVLLQSAKGEGLAGAFGGGGGVSGAVFGGRGAASFLSRATTVLAIMFMALAGGESAVQKAAQSAGASVPATDVSGTQPETATEPQSEAAQELFSQPADSGS